MAESRLHADALAQQLAASNEKCKSQAQELQSAKQRAVKRIKSQIERIADLEGQLAHQRLVPGAVPSYAAADDCEALERLCVQLVVRQETWQRQAAERTGALSAASREHDSQLAHQLQQVRLLSASLHNAELARERAEEEAQEALALHEAALHDAELQA
jgi:hypothetical protein